MLKTNTALAKAIIDSGKKKKTIARLAGLKPYEISRVLHGTKVLDKTKRERLASVLQTSVSDIFPSEASAA